MQKAKLPSTAVGRTRLLKLAGLLEADAKNSKGIRFDLGAWGETMNKSDPLSCETTACAMGLAALSGAFSRQGLTHSIDRKGSMNVSFKNRGNGITAAMKLFAITEAQADDLFIYGWRLPSTTGAVGERALAKRIRRFVAGKYTIENY